MFTYDDDKMLTILLCYSSSFFNCFDVSYKL